MSALAWLFAAAVGAPAPAGLPSVQRVVLTTSLGPIEIEVNLEAAPITAANFLKYVDARHYDGGVFHRTVRLDNQPDAAVKIEVVQAGVNPVRAHEGWAPIQLERTQKTGLKRL